MKKVTAKNMFEPPNRADYDEGMLGDTAYEWAVERWQMENHKLGPGYAKSVASELPDTRVNRMGVHQVGKSNKLRLNFVE